MQRDQRRALGTRTPRLRGRYHARVLRRSFPSLFALACALALAGCGPGRPPVRSLDGFAQGTTYTVQWWSTQGADERTLAAALEAELERIDRLLSNYRPDSDLEVLNAAVSTEAQLVPEELVELLRLAADVHRASEGCFDPTVRPLVHVWGFDGDEPAVPSAERLIEARARVGLDKLEIVDARTVRKTVPDLAVDMSSIGQGYTVGRLAAVVESLGLRDYIVEIGGELLVRGRKPDGQPWRVGIENPAAGGGPLQRLTLRNADPTAVITSGTYRHFFEAGGREYGHILDPRTGRPVEHGLVEVTVIGEDPARAAAWATALLCLGPEDAARIADREALAATFAVRTADGIARTSSALFPAAAVAD